MRPLFRLLALLPVVLLVAIGARAQQVTFAEHIAPLVYNHCSSCHHTGGLAPFPLMSYQDVVQHSHTIEVATSLRFMPPWKADPSFSHFLDENVLTDAEIQQISDWVADGLPRGNVALEPAPPTFTNGSSLGTPDLVVPMAQAFTHQGNGQDMYRIFVLPITLPADRDVAAMEFRPGNRSIVHHAIMALDTTGRARQLDAAQAGYGYTQFGGFGFAPTTDNFEGWVPGARSRFYPPGLGKRMFRRCDLIVQVHYGPSSVTQTDSSVVNVFFTPQPATRQVQTLPVSVFSLTNGPFVIPPNQVKLFHARITVPTDLSLNSVLPHSHLLGKSWKAWAVKPNGDTVNLIHIPDWDFNWQGSYRFPRLTRLPAGTTVYIDASYDNTSNNPRNPFSPPQQVVWGEETTAEMFVIYFDAVPYRPGDENIVLGGAGLDDDSPLPDGLRRPATRLYPPHPNPSAGEAVTVSFTLGQAGRARLTLHDAQGRVVRRLTPEAQAFPSGGSTVPLSTDGLAPGLYWIYLEAAGSARQMQQVVVLPK